MKTLTFALYSLSIFLFVSQPAEAVVILNKSKSPEVAKYLQTQFVQDIIRAEKVANLVLNTDTKNFFENLFITFEDYADEVIPQIPLTGHYEKEKGKLRGRRTVRMEMFNRYLSKSSNVIEDIRRVLFHEVGHAVFELYFQYNSRSYAMGGLQNDPPQFTSPDSFDIARTFIIMIAPFGELVADIFRNVVLGVTGDFGRDYTKRYWIKLKLDSYLNKDLHEVFALVQYYYMNNFFIRNRNNEKELIRSIQALVEVSITRIDNFILTKDGKLNTGNALVWSQESDNIIKMLKAKGI